MKSIVLSTLFLFANSASAFSVDPVISAGMDFGGDLLVDITYTDGSRSKINAGDGLFVNAGINSHFLQLTESRTLSLQTTLGYKFESTKQASNGNIKWTHFLIDAILFYNFFDANNKYGYRFGVGPSFHQSNKVKGDGIASSIDFKTDNEVGVLVQGDFAFGSQKQYLIGARAVFIKFSAPGTTEKADANSIGLSFTYLFKDIPLISQK